MDRAATDRQALYDAVLTRIDQERATILGVADAIHARPELALEERFAADLLAGTVEGYGFAVERGAGGVETAFKARRRGRGEGPAIGFLAEYDALPGLGHGCGHNLIAGSNLAAAVGLAAVIDRLPGEVMLIGTPAEEAKGGKLLMIAGGAFDDVDVALSSHHAGDATTIATEPPRAPASPSLSSASSTPAKPPTPRRTPRRGSTRSTRSSTSSSGSTRSAST
jgi:metal-dependent amidase/aminoacylase/carboxypeptidase family protein